MKLIYKINYRLSVALLLIMAVWAMVFYFIIIDEINDETDDALEDYSEQLITRSLSGESLPLKGDGTNNNYYLLEVTPEYADRHEEIRYSDEKVWIEFKNETEPARILKTIFRDSENRYYELTVLIPTIEKEDLQATIMWWIISLYILLLIVIVGINIWVLHGSLRPLYQLIEWIDNFRVGKTFTPLSQTTDVTEFNKLNDAVLRSANRNVEIYEQQKNFIGHASHELQTPLAICRNRLETLADDSLITQKQLEEVMKTLATLDHIIKLNRTLLLLAKIENAQFPDKQSISVNALVKRLTDDYVEVYAHRNIKVEITENGSMSVDMNETLASVFFSNLLKNAFFYTPENGNVRVDIDSSQVVFSNVSIGEALDADMIFKRFYKGTTKEGSTGLGLALVDSIARLYRIKITYDYENKQHNFTVRI